MLRDRVAAYIVVGEELASSRASIAYPFGFGEAARCSKHHDLRRREQASCSPTSGDRRAHSNGGLRSSRCFVDPDLASEMARGQVTRLDFAQRWHGGRADFLRKWAARPEAAAGGRIDRTRRVAGQQEPFPAHP